MALLQMSGLRLSKLPYTRKMVPITFSASPNRFRVLMLDPEKYMARIVAIIKINFMYDS